MPPEPTRARRQLADHLRLLRGRSGTSQEAVATGASLSQSKVSRVERGSQPLSVAELDRWLDVLQAPENDRAVALELLDATAAESSPWRAEYRGNSTGHSQSDLEVRTRAARHVSELQTAVVPGLLQTAAYTRSLLPLVDHVTGGLQDRSATIHARQARQEVLYQSGRRFEFLLTERAFAGKALSAEVMSAQRARIKSTATLDNIDIGVVPDSEVNAEIGFMLFDEVEDGAASTAVELPHGPLIVYAPEDVAIYRDLFALLRSASSPL